MFKDNINFIVKGYEILKTIQNKLIDIKSKRIKITNLNNLNNNEINEFNNNQILAKIFSNMNFSISIEFSLENYK